MRGGKLVLVVLLALGGALAKILGGVLYGSRALMVDALTSVANLLALGGTIYYYRKSLVPPDEDHHYGHYKLSLGGAFVTLITYSFVAGLAVAEILFAGEYSVDVRAPAAAAVGMLFYGGAIVVARSAGSFFAPYSVFTASELIEGATVLGASLGGALLSYAIDLAGACVITLYLFYELYDVSRDFMERVGDVAPPTSIVRKVVSEVEKIPGVKVKRLRLRYVAAGRYQGDIVVGVDPKKSVGEAHAISNKIEEVLSKRFGIDVVVHIEPVDLFEAEAGDEREGLKLEYDEPRED